MSQRLQHMHAEYARRREAEVKRVQQKEELNRYYDHWGKVTSRFENWSTPEYYEKAGNKLKEKKEKKSKEQELDVRREKLRTLFSSEQSIYDGEMKERKKPRARKIPADAETLERVDRELKEREQIRRKLELEAKLYGRWRHGVDDDKLIFDSKNEHQVLAKLNWLDKQVDDQLQRDKDEAEMQERNIRLQEEINRTEQAHKERQLIREQEIKEIRALQEKHMSELKERQEECETLKEEEKHFRIFLEEIEKEEELLVESSSAILKPAEEQNAQNLKRIKVFIRQRSEAFRNQIELCISILERLRAYGIKTDTINGLIKKYRDQIQSEIMSFEQIESMYESEVKYTLQRCEDNWRDQHLLRYQELRDLLNSEQQSFSSLLEENMRQQSEIVDMRATHLSAIENSNEKLKLLIKEQEQPAPASTNDVDAESTVVGGKSVATSRRGLRNTPSAMSVGSSTSLRRSSNIPKLTNSFSNLNLDCWKDIDEVGSTTNLSESRSQKFVTADDAERPKFGRKRVAWT